MTLGEWTDKAVALVAKLRTQNRTVMAQAVIAIGFTDRTTLISQLGDLSRAIDELESAIPSITSGDMDPARWLDQAEAIGASLDRLADALHSGTVNVDTIGEAAKDVARWGSFGAGFAIVMVVVVLIVLYAPRS